jgi:hypothetical protein
VHAGFGGRLPGKGPPTRDLAGQPTLPYRFGYKDGLYTATSRKSDHATLTARDAGELLTQVRRHYRPPLQERSST